MIRKRNGSMDAFTIVELLIVIVVIGILAAITIVAYNGVQNRARTAGLQQTLASSAKVVENSRTTAGTSTYPSSVTGLDASVTYANPNPTLGGFCATKTDGTLTYMVTASNKTPHSGPGCTLTNLVTNPSIEVNATGWTGATNAPVSRVTTFASDRTASLQVARNATAGNGYISTPITTTVGKKYAISFDVRSTTGAPSLSATVKNTSATGTTVGDASTLTIVPTASFTRYTVTWTAENTASYFVLDDTVVSTTYLLDAIMATEGENSTSYVDPLVASGGWTWTSTVDGSTSTGPAF